MKASDMRAKTADELKTQLGDLRKEAFNLRFQQANGVIGPQSGNTARVEAVRRDIARIQTVLKQKAPPKEH